jgi:TRAP-type C4-dicarboxylate transport system permease small subunit
LDSHALITGFGLLAGWCGFRLCLHNHTLTTHGLEINLAWLYASSVVGGILAVYGFAMIISSPPQDQPQH